MPSANAYKDRHTHPALGRTLRSLRVRSHPLLILLNVGLTLAIFSLDLLVATDIAIGMLYVAPVAWMALWSSKHDTPLMVATAVSCTLLTIVGFLLHPSGIVWIGFVNRLI